MLDFLQLVLAAMRQVSPRSNEQQQQQQQQTLAYSDYYHDETSTDYQEGDYYQDSQDLAYDIQQVSVTPILRNDGLEREYLMSQVQTGNPSISGSLDIADLIASHKASISAFQQDLDLSSQQGLDSLTLTRLGDKSSESLSIQSSSLFEMKFNDADLSKTLDMAQQSGTDN